MLLGPTWNNASCSVNRVFRGGDLKFPKLLFKLSPLIFQHFSLLEQFKF